MKITVGTRGSNLAVTQTNWVIDQLKAAHPELEVDVTIIKTKGDKILDKPLNQIGDKGLFVKEIEQALLDGSIDLAVHSMKDMPSDQPDGLILVAPPQRADHRDALVLREGLSSLEDIPQGGKLGTGSIRRIAQIQAIRPDITCVSVRGNVETRMKKIETENLDGVVLAAAGLKRLGLENRISAYLSNEQMLAAPAQGILAVEVRETDDQVKALMEAIVHGETALATRAERAYLNHADGSCHMPIGAVLEEDGDQIVLKGLLGTEDGRHLVRDQIRGDRNQAEAMGVSLAKRLQKALQDKVDGQEG